MVKRSYHAPRRQEQARATRGAVIEAAHRLFVDQGYVATSISQIAKLARVGDQTVYRLFGDKPSLLREVLLTALGGEDEPVVATESALMDEIGSAATPGERLQLVAEWIHDSYQRGVAELEEVLFSAETTDPRLGELAAFAREKRYQDVHGLAQGVFGSSAPLENVTIEDVADYIYAIESSPVYRQLVGERGWSIDKYVEWFVRLIERMFLADS